MRRQNQFLFHSPSSAASGVPAVINYAAPQKMEIYMHTLAISAVSWKSSWGWRSARPLEPQRCQRRILTKDNII